MVVDAVVLAAPWEFSNLTLPPQAVAALGTPRAYRHWFVTVVCARGGLAPEFFGYPASHNLSWVQNVLTTQNTSSSVPFNVVQLETTPLADGSAYWKLFSNADVTSHLDHIFRGVFENETVVQHWPYTFPLLHPVSASTPSGYQSLEPMQNFFYLNAIESVSTAMECSVLAGRNAALLMKQR